MELINLTVSQEDANVRIDKYIAKNVRNLNRSQVINLFEEGSILCNDKAVKKNYKVKCSDEISIAKKDPISIDTKPVDIPIEIIYEDSDIIVVNKPRGMVVHPAPGHYEDTLVNALLYHCKDLAGINDKIRPGIVHRIDKDTTGLLVVAKNDIAQLSLSEQIKKKEAGRIYLALVHDNIAKDTGIVDMPIGRMDSDRKKMSVRSRNTRSAKSKFKVLERFGKYTLIQVKLETGRTHQIRVHMSYIKHPVVGDLVYGVKHQPFKLEGQLLHAYKLIIKHPKTGEKMEFEAELPNDFRNILEKLRKK